MLLLQNLLIIENLVIIFAVRGLQICFPRAEEEVNQLQIRFDSFFHINNYKEGTSIMGVSISKSSAYTQMKKKSKNKHSSKSKDFNKNVIQNTIEGHRLKQHNPNQPQSLALYQSLHAKHPIESLALATKEGREIPIDMHGNQNTNSSSSSVEDTTEHRSKLKNMKKTLRFSERQALTDEQNNDPTEQFTKAQVINKQHSRTPSYYSIHTKKETSTPPSTFDPNSASSRRSIASKATSSSGTNKNIDDQFFSSSEWRLAEENCIRNKDYRKFVQFKSINLSNKFAQMGAHLHQGQEHQYVSNRHHNISSRILVGARHPRHS